MTTSKNYNFPILNLILLKLSLISVSHFSVFIQNNLSSGRTSPLTLQIFISHLKKDTAQVQVEAFINESSLLLAHHIAQL